MQFTNIGVFNTTMCWEAKASSVVSKADHHKGARFLGLIHVRVPEAFAAFGKKYIESSMFTSKENA